MTFLEMELKAEGGNTFNGAFISLTAAMQELKPRYRHGTPTWLVAWVDMRGRWS